MRLSIQRTACLIRASDEFTLLSQTPVQAGKFCSKLQGVFAAAMIRNAGEHRREDGNRAESKKRRENPETAPLADNSRAERFDGDIRVMLSLHRILEHGLEFFFGLPLAKLS